MPRFTLTAGVRYDYHNVYGGKPSARLGGVVPLAPNAALQAALRQRLQGAVAAAALRIAHHRRRHQRQPAAARRATCTPSRGSSRCARTPTSHLTGGLAYNDVLDQAEFSRVGLNQVAQQHRRGPLAVGRERAAPRLPPQDRRLRQRVVEPHLAHHQRPGLRRGADRLQQRRPTRRSSRTPAPAARSRRLPLSLSVEGSYVSARASSGTNTLAYGTGLPPGPLLPARRQPAHGGIQLLPGADDVAGPDRAQHPRHPRRLDPGFAGVDYPRLGRTLMLHLLQEL